MLHDAVRCALLPQGLRERIRVLTVGGWSAVQVRSRLSDEAASAWLASATGPAIVKERALIEAVRIELLALVSSGAAKRTATTYGVELRSKGQRQAVVDVFRLT
ncbi:hypothetical protein LBMAG42_02950 [Deltaproteobacteria bacterium]|nr:hypothetical protein LBMAG42_02950 [Deltaproteobacteria bacterium]